jgi:chromosome segregation ATPase
VESSREQVYQRRIAELEAEVASLKAQIARLIAQNARLSDHNARLSDQIASLAAQNTRLSEQIAKLSKNSSNSSKPPSSDIVRLLNALRGLFGVIHRRASMTPAGFQRSIEKSRQDVIAAATWAPRGPEHGPALSQTWRILFPLYHHAGRRTHE